MNKKIIKSLLEHDYQTEIDGEEVLFWENPSPDLITHELSKLEESGDYLRGFVTKSGDMYVAGYTENFDHPSLRSSLIHYVPSLKSSFPLMIYKNRAINIIFSGNENKSSAIRVMKLAQRKNPRWDFTVVDYYSFHDTPNESGFAIRKNPKDDEDDKDEDDIDDSFFSPVDEEIKAVRSLLEMEIDSDYTDGWILYNGKLTHVGYGNHEEYLRSNKKFTKMIGDAFSLPTEEELESGDYDNYYTDKFLKLGGWRVDTNGEELLFDGGQGRHIDEVQEAILTHFNDWDDDMKVTIYRNNRLRSEYTIKEIKESGV